MNKNYVGSYIIFIISIVLLSLLLIWGCDNKCHCGCVDCGSSCRLQCTDSNCTPGMRCCDKCICDPFSK